MSGHSKWSSIKHKKALTDAKKGKVFSKLASLISIASKHGGDPAMNPNLRVYLDKARQAGMPKENIDRAIKRGTGELGGATLEEVVYEAYGPGGVGIIIEGVTDNRNRTVAEIKAVLNKYNGRLADTGAVSYQFDTKGIIVVDVRDASADEISLCAIDAGAQDVVEEDENIIVYTKPNELENTKKTLEDSGYSVQSAEVSLEPHTTVAITPDKSQTIEKLLNQLDDLDDVTSVSTNVQID